MNHGEAATSLGGRISKSGLLVPLLLLAILALALAPKAIAFTSGQSPSVTLSGSGIATPAGIAFDSSGNLWAADSTTGDVREYTASSIAATGTPTAAVTLTNGLSFPSGVAFDSAGNLWVSDVSAGTSGEVLEFTPPFSSSESASATISSSILGPEGLAFDSSGNLWVSNYNGPGAVNEYAASSLNSNPSSSLTVSVSASSLRGIVFDSSGNLWVDSQGGSEVLEYASPYTGSAAITLTHSTNGVTYPSSMALDSSGNLWVGDGGGNVFEFAAPVSGSSTAAVTLSSSSGLSSPWGVAFDASGNLWVADNSASKIFEFAGPAPVPDLPYGVLPLLLAIPLLYYMVSRMPRKRPATLGAWHSGPNIHFGDSLSAV